MTASEHRLCVLIVSLSLLVGLTAAMRVAPDRSIRQWPRVCAVGAEAACWLRIVAGKAEGQPPRAVLLPVTLPDETLICVEQPTGEPVCLDVRYWREAMAQ